MRSSKNNNIKKVEAYGYASTFFIYEVRKYTDNIKDYKEYVEIYNNIKNEAGVIL
ncbi:hypothetical protein [Clostridium sp.]|uniref:hypothetical protein n=1 Tax=Clostridium sp. TaxID=1506 RepID=UPI003D6D281B